MSLLASFGAGFLGQIGKDMDQKEADRRAAEERKRTYAERIAEEARVRKLDRADREEERKQRLADTREGFGYNPETSMMEGIDGLGNPVSRKATAAEQAAYRASQEEAKRKGLLDELKAEDTRANINLRNARAENARAAASRPRDERDDKAPQPVKPEVALAALGLTTEPTAGSPEHAVWLELQGGLVDRLEARDRLTVLRRQRNSAQAEQDYITNRLPGGM